MKQQWVDVEDVAGRLRMLQVGTAGLGASIRGGSAALVFASLGLVIPWWIAGLLAYFGLLLAEFLVTRHAEVVEDDRSIGSPSDHAFEEPMIASVASRQELPVRDAKLRIGKNGAIPVSAAVGQPPPSGLASGRPFGVRSQLTWTTKSLDRTAA